MISYSLKSLLNAVKPFVLESGLTDITFPSRFVSALFGSFLETPEGRKRLKKACVKYARMSLKDLSDEALIAGFRDSLLDEREALVRNLEYIGELDRRKLFYHHSSLRAFLVAEHGMDQKNAKRKIRAARMLKRFPGLKGKLESGKLCLKLLAIASGCASREGLSDPELWELMEGISGMTCDGAIREIASRYPDSVILPSDKVRPINEEYSEVRFVANQELLDQLEEIRGLLAHSHPGIKLGDLFGLMARDYLKRHHPEERAKRAQERDLKKNQSEFIETPAPVRANARVEKYVPSQELVHRLVLSEGYTCSYIDPITKTRCTSRFALQRDHVLAWAKGGRTSLSNMRFLCRNHHGRISFLEFGDKWKERLPDKETS